MQKVLYSVRDGLVCCVTKCFVICVASALKCQTIDSYVTAIHLHVFVVEFPWEKYETKYQKRISYERMHSLILSFMIVFKLQFLLLSINNWCLEKCWLYLVICRRIWNWIFLEHYEWHYVIGTKAWYSIPKLIWRMSNTHFDSFELACNWIVHVSNQKYCVAIVPCLLPNHENTNFVSVSYIFMTTPCENSEQFNFLNKTCSYYSLNR